VLTDFLRTDMVDGLPRQAQQRRLDRILVFSLETGELVGILEDDYLQRVRVGAEAAVAARKLARQDAATIGLLGSGRQAASQLQGLCVVRPIRAVRVCSPTPEHRAAFARRMAAELGIAVEPVADAPAAVRGADIVVAATSTSEPTLRGAWLEPGQHVISIVNADKTVRRREVDDEVMRRCTPIIISTREQVQQDEPADIYEPLRVGLITWDKLLPMADLEAGLAPGRATPEQITMHKNNGMAIQFAAAAGVALERAREMGLGRELPAYLTAEGDARAL
jgi:ornithine cyclodeaminase/alanine dehydrogenase-like protein (mu-crystallin family)